MSARQPKLAYAVDPMTDARSMRGRIEAVFGSALPVYPPEPAVSPWQERPLEAEYAFLFIDSMPLRIREEGLMCSRRLHFVLGVLQDGSKDILAFTIEDPATQAFWPQAVRQLKARGMVRVQMVVAENHAAISQAFRAAAFSSTTVVPNVRIAARKLLDDLSQTDRLRALREISRCFAGEASPGALSKLACVRAHPTADWQALENDAVGICELPAAVRKLVCTTTATESVVEKLRRRGFSKRGNFANREAASRELVLVLQDARGAWRVAPNVWQPIRRCMNSGK